MAKVRCQRIGCDAMFSEDDNPDGSCTYHDADEDFKEKFDWETRMGIGDGATSGKCKTGKHTTEKPVLAKAAAAPKLPVSTPTPTTNLSSKDTCSRCRQGFFCSDHGSQARELNPKTSNASGDALGGSNSDLKAAQPPPPKKIIDIHHPQICKNKGCGKTFKERDNHDTACSYHPGPAVFHDRMRGWKCCDIHVKEFDEFMSIPPCAKGWHNADPLP
ncbi:UNVERIFIED_CONTAM: Cysteine and histidine-rich domain-containing protein RAR1 [Sesamum calycinum]|uniref:Cysteine and histidine-rich domain-containing protein RAR1 n=1 Tax=Sesamum calycinum TaxID=2727403 RepID=A0AAW2RQA0_9LAMI